MTEVIIMEPITTKESISELIDKMKQLDENSILLLKNSAETLLVHQELIKKRQKAG